jgi:hypothetical protein
MIAASKNHLANTLIYLPPYSRSICPQESKNCILSE